MRTYKRALYMIMGGFLCLAGILGCDSENNNPTASDTVVRIGQTTGGRSFEVIQEMTSEGQGVLKVRIEGKEDIEIESFVGIVKTVLDSIQVEELAGTSPLILITWQDNWYSLHTSRHYHYLAVAEEDPTLIVFRQECSFDFDGHYLFSWTVGKYYLDYENDIMHIVEHWKECSGSGCGSLEEYQLKEVQFSRSYEVKYFGSDLNLLTCEERSRSTGTLSASVEPPVKNLEPPLPGEWQLTDLSTDDILHKCAPIDHTY